MLEGNPEHTYYLNVLIPFCGSRANPDYSRLDVLLYAEYGDRPIGEIPKLYAVNGEYTDSAVQALAAHVFHQLYASWDRLIESMCREYEPLENYSMKESGTDIDKEIGETVGNTNTRGFNFELEQEIGEETVTADFVDASETETDYHVTNTIPATTTQESVATYDATEKNTAKTTVSPDGVSPNQSQTTMTESGMHSSVVADKRDKGHTHDFQRSGNIGVMTATQMLEADTSYWSANDFYSTIASTIASIVTNPYYE